MTDRSAPEELRDAAILAAASSMPGWNNGCLIPSATANQWAVNQACVEVATPMVDAVLAVVAKHRDETGEWVDTDTLDHLRRQAGEWRRHICPVERVVLDQGLDIVRERDVAQDRIARALVYAEAIGSTRLEAILRGTDQEAP